MAKGVCWVVGASSGLGLSTARAFAKSGWSVIAGARSFDGSDEGNDGITRLHLDVTSEESVRDFANCARDRLGDADALVYCAGLLVMGACEETGDENYKNVMDTNFIGMTRMVSSVLPAMRARGSGKIVLLSSINGLLGIPFQSAYTASKHAIEGYTECLNMEVKPFGVDVILIEPGDHRGGSQHTRLLCESEASPYKEPLTRAVAKIRRDEARGLDPDRLGGIVVRRTEGQAPRFRSRVAKLDQRLAVLLHRFTPPFVGFRVLTGYYTGGGNSK